MANEFYITAGLPAIDSADIGSVGTNAFYITAGLPANDYESEPATFKAYWARNSNVILQPGA